MNINRQIAIGAAAFAFTALTVTGIAVAGAMSKKQAKVVCEDLAARRAILLDLAQMSEGSTKAHAQASYERKVAEMSAANCDAILS